MDNQELTAQEVLQCLLTDDEFSQTYRQLEEQLRGSGITPFVGAGLCKPHNFPLWPEFLYNEAERCSLSKKSLIVEHVKSDEYEDAAEGILSARGQRRFHDAIDRTFGRENLPAGKITGTISLLPMLSQGPVVTTNYDPLLEHVYEQEGRKFDDIIIGGRYADRATQAINALGNVLLQIHGSYKDREDRILTKSDYDRYYGALDEGLFDAEKPLPKRLVRLFHVRPVLFIGCGLNKDRTLKVLDKFIETHSDIILYAIVERPEDENKFYAKDYTLSDIGIRVLWYPHGRHDVVEEILKSLIKQIPAQSSPNAPMKSNLPPSLTSFLGREKEAHQLAQLISDQRLVTLTGSGGVGKSRLALEVCHTLNTSFKDGILLVELASTSGSHSVVRAILNVLGIKDEGSSSPEDVFIAHFHSKQNLLLLDNCEHLIEQCACIVTFLLQGCPNLKVLATSRESLNVTGEQVFPVEPLSVPQGLSENLTQEELKASPSVQLFIDRARMVQPNLTFSDAELVIIGEICRKLDGLPLAIELAAARVKTLRVADICSQLTNRFNLLIGGHRNLHLRQQTLEATIDWSYNLLTEPEQEFFRSSTIFSGQVVSPITDYFSFVQGREPYASLPMLTSLAEKSLLTTSIWNSITSYRYLESIREYGRKKLTDLNEVDKVRLEHFRTLKGFLDFTHDAKSAPKQIVGMNLLDLLKDDLHETMVWSSNSSELYEETLDLVILLPDYIDMREQWHNYFDYAEKMIERYHDSTSLQYAYACNSAAIAATDLGHHPTAIEMLLRSLDIAKREGELSLQAKVYNNLGRLCFSVSDFQSASNFYKRSVEIKNDLPREECKIGRSLMQYASCEVRLHHMENAETLLIQAQQIAEEEQDYFLLAECLRCRADKSLREGNRIEANYLAKEANVIFTQYGSLRDITNCETILALTTEDLSESVRLLQQIVETERRLKNIPDLSVALYNLGNAASEIGNDELAQSCREESRQLRQENGLPPLRQ